MTLAELNAMSAPEFVASLGGLFEHSPWVPERVAPMRPFAASSQEQQRAGLEACTPWQYAQLERLNAAYFEKFGFPFILAVRGHTPESILEQCSERLERDAASEQAAALKQIGLIAGYRLAQLLEPSVPSGLED